MHRTRVFLATMWITVIGILSGANLATNSHAQDPAKKDEKRITISFDQAPWRKVIEWYADQSGMPYASTFPAPPGTFTFSSPKGRDHTLIEAMGIINGQLEKEGFVLVPRTKTFTMVSVPRKK